MRFLILFLFLNCSLMTAQEKEVLVFHKTAGYYHESTPRGIETLKELGKGNGLKIFETDNSEDFSEEFLQKFSLVIFLNTGEDVLNDEQQVAFKNYIENGGNFFGIHGASNTEFDWPWFGKLLGAYFLDHPEIQQAEVLVAAPEHPTVAHLPKTWTCTDEWYNFKDINPDIEVLLTLNEDSYEGGKNGEFHPIAWYQKLPAGGISVYTARGHSEESYAEPEFREHLLRCMLFAIGE